MGKEGEGKGGGGEEGRREEGGNGPSAEPMAELAEKGYFEQDGSNRPLYPQTTQMFFHNGR